MKNYITKKHRLLLSLICIYIFVIFILSAVYKANHLNHICTEIECPICHNIQKLENLINSLSLSFLTIVSPILFLNILKKYILYDKSNKIKLSPIKLKVRMNN